MLGKDRSRILVDARALEFLRRSNRGIKDEANSSNSGSGIVGKIVSSILTRSGSKRRSLSVDDSTSSDKTESNNLHMDDEQLGSPVCGEKRTKPSYGSPRESTVLCEDSSDDSVSLHTGRSSDPDW